MNDLTYEFGNETHWMQKTGTFIPSEDPRCSDPYEAFSRAKWRSVYCYVFKDEELIAVIDCTSWAETAHRDGNAPALVKFLEDKLK